MKYLLILGILINLSLSQSMSGHSTEHVYFLNIINTNSSETIIREDLNYDGKTEILNGGKIIRLDENEFWVQNTSLTTNTGVEIIFNNKITKNDIPLFKKASADNGYVLLFYSGVNEVIVYFADKNGSKDSDPIAISLD